MWLWLLAAVSHLGNVVVWLAIASALSWTGREEARGLIPALISCFILTGAIKAVVGAPRPPGGLVPVEDPYSFPSGHTAIAFLAASYLAVGVEGALRPALIAMAVAVAYSRVALGVHRVVDVVGGAIVGLMVALAFTRLRGREGALAVPMIALSPVLYLAFPIRPGLASGLALGYGVSELTRPRGQARVGVVGVAVGGLVLASLVSLFLVELPRVVECLVAFTFTLYATNVHVRVAEAFKASAR